MIGNSETADDEIRAYYRKRVREMMFSKTVKDQLIELHDDEQH